MGSCGIREDPVGV
ncbi:unnamed protein product, partial [Didymodactylos carnosus]